MSTSLPVNIDSAYADSGTDASVKLHQVYHDSIHNYTNEKHGTLGNKTGATTLDLSDASVAYTVTMTGNVIFTFANMNLRHSFVLLLKQDGTGSRTVTWPAAVKWEAGVAPVLSTAISATDILSFFTVDQGVTWYGFFLGKGMS